MANQLETENVKRSRPLLNDEAYHFLERAGWDDF